MMDLLITAAQAQTAVVPVNDSIPWWSALAEIAVTVLAGTLSLLALVLLPILRSWLMKQTLLAAILQDTSLAAKMDEGAINIIRAAEEKLLQRIPGESDLAAGIQDAFRRGDQPIPKEHKQRVVEEARPILEREFKETLQHFGKTPTAVTEYLMGRVDRALKG